MLREQLEELVMKYIVTCSQNLSFLKTRSVEEVISGDKPLEDMSNQELIEVLRKLDLILNP